MVESVREERMKEKNNISANDLKPELPTLFWLGSYYSNDYAYNGSIV